MKKTAFFILLIFVSAGIFSQNILNVPSIDTETYNLFLKKNWKKIIETEKKVRKNGISFYYLDYRTGIAYYELKKYSKALKYFKKIYENNKDDKILQEYLYFSYLFSGRYDDARFLAASFDEKLKKKLDIETKHTIIKSFFTSTKRDFNQDYSYIPKAGENVNQISILQQNWYNAGFEHYINDRITIIQGYTYIKTENEIKTNDNTLPASFNEKINQNEYYLSLKYHIAEGLNITGAFHFLRTFYKAVNPVSAMPRKPFSSEYLYYFGKNSFAGFLKADKYFSIFNVSAESSISDFNNNLQIQPAVNFRIYPFFNNRFYAETSGILLAEKENGIFEYSPVITQSLGSGFLKYSYFNAYLSYGELKNYCEYNIFTVYNDLDKSKLRTGISVNFGFAKGKSNLFFNYKYNLKENNFEINGIKHTKEYINMFVNIGIKQYFGKHR